MRLCPSCEVAYPDDREQCPRDGTALPGSRLKKDPLVGAVIATRYKVRERLSVGRTAAIYRIEHEPLKKELILKLATAATMAKPERVQRFLLQARAAAAVRVGGTPIVDFGCLRDGTCYLIMEPCRGVSLASLLTEGPLPLPRALAVTTALAHILDTAHSQGFVYGDLCAAEVFLRSDPPTGTSVVDGLCLLDWGGVYALADSPRWPKDEADLPRCRPPEAVADKPVTALADQYQLAALTLELLTGPVSAAALSSRPLPKALHLTLARALSPRPEERFALIREFAEALRRALPLTLSELPGAENDPPLRFCPLCGNASVDTEGYGGSGSGRCTHCGTIFTVLASPARLPSLT